MMKYRCHKKVWDFGLVYKSEIMSRMSFGSDYQEGTERITGDTTDISEWIDFTFYQTV